jgi:hypothetical protein
VFDGRAALAGGSVMNVPPFGVGARVRYNSTSIAVSPVKWKTKGARFVIIQPPFYVPPDDRYDAHGWFVLVAPLIDLEMLGDGFDPTNDADSIADFRAQTDHNGTRCVYLRCDEIEGDTSDSAMVALDESAREVILRATKRDFDGAHGLAGDNFEGLMGLVKP